MSAAREVLIFDVAGKRYGVESTTVQEVLRAVSLSPIPRAPEIVEGLLNRRGQLVPVLDLRRLLGLPARPLQHTDHLLVLETEGLCFAVRVDRAIDLLALLPDHEGGRNEGAPLVHFVAKTRDGLVNVIHPHMLVMDEEIRNDLHAIVESAATVREP